MKIGFIQFVVNPLFPVDRMKARGGKNMECHDDLHCRILMIEQDGEKPIYHLSLDAVELWRPFRDQIKAVFEETLGREVVLIESVTHSHLCPFNKTDAAYREFLLEKIRENLVKIEPKEIQKLSYSYQYRFFDKIGNSRVPKHLAQVYAETLSLYGDGKRLGTILIHNVHPTIHKLGNEPFTSEYPGYCIRKLREKYPDEFFTFLLGPAGDISSHNVRKGQDFEEMERLAELLTKEYERQLDAQKEEDIREVEHLIYREKTMPIYRRPFDIDKLELPDDATEEEINMVNRYRETGGWPLPEDEILSEYLISQLIFSKEYSVIFEPFELYSEYYGAVEKDACTIATVSNGYDHYLTGLYMDRIGMGYNSDFADKTRRQLWQTLKLWGRQLED